jgi:hypothetical protein
MSHPLWMRSPRNLGWRKIMKYRITIGIATLAFGAAVAASPALAQQYGKSANDGGPFSAPQSNSQPLYNSVTPQASTAPSYGKAANDGGMVSEPNAGKTAAAKPQDNTAQPATPPHYGKAPNDGGM